MGLGYLKRGPATAGAVAGAVIFYFIQPIHVWVIVMILVAVFLLGVCGSSLISKEEKVKDPQYIIIDEVVGCWVALLFLPASLLIYGLGTLLFRVLDKTKILGIKEVERLPGGWGIMLDDVVAGIYANIIIQIFLSVYGRIA